VCCDRREHCQAERTDGLIENGESTAAALNSGYHLAFWIGAGLVLIALALAVTVLKPEPAKTAHADVDVDLEPAYSEAA
jgi:hypothetical protein